MLKNIIEISILFIVTFTSVLVGANENITYKESNFSNDGYRSKNYRSPTPTQTSFAKIVDADEIIKLSKKNVNLVVVDVIPLSMDGSTFIQTKPHEGIANSIWLPNVGFGQIDGMTKNYLVDNLKTSMKKNSETVFVFYCKTDCWMSWNAARRASSLGFKNIFWYKNGIDGWKTKNLATQFLNPEIFIKK